MLCSRIDECVTEPNAARISHKEKKMNQLERLKTMTSVVADTGDLLAIKQVKPEDATTNPSLILQATQLKGYQNLLQQTLQESRQFTDVKARVSYCADALAVNIGYEILQIISGCISTEVDARLSFDTQAMIQKAKQLIELYAAKGISKERVLIKLAATWEGIQAAEQLEKQGIRCNLTLLFSMPQAQACADAGVYLISPFVGRILDWYQAQPDFKLASAEQDPGVQSVRAIYAYYKTYHYPTVVMGASFRNKQQIIELAGCDKLTISPNLIAELAQSDEAFERKLNAQTTQCEQAKTQLSQAQFRWQHNDNAMAEEKLAQGIRCFGADQIKLEQTLINLIKQHA